MSRAARLSLCLLTSAGVAAALTGCGGSSAKPKAETTTTAAPTTTTAPAATVPVSDPTAAKAALRLTDLGAGFGVYRKAAGYAAVGTKSCVVVVPGSGLTTRDHIYSGPMFKKASATFYVYSDAYVFRNAARAKQYVTFRASPAFTKCKVKQDDAATRKVTPANYVKLTTAPFSDATGRITTMYRELQGGPNAAGKLTDAAFYDRYTFRHGRVVVVLSIDSALPTDDAASQTIAADTSAALESVNTALDARLATS